jgi:hypothetical protein
VVRRGGIDDVLRRQHEGLARVFFVADALAGDRDVHAVIAQDILQQAHVREARYVFEDQLLLGK